MPMNNSGEENNLFLPLCTVGGATINIIVRQFDENVGVYSQVRREREPLSLGQVLRRPPTKSIQALAA